MLKYKIEWTIDDCHWQEDIVEAEDEFHAEDMAWENADRDYDDSRNVLVTEIEE